MFRVQVLFICYYDSKVPIFILSSPLPPGIRIFELQRYDMGEIFDIESDKQGEVSSELWRYFYSGAILWLFLMVVLVA